MPPWLKPDKEEQCVCMLCDNAEELAQQLRQLMRRVHPSSFKDSHHRPTTIVKEEKLKEEMEGPIHIKKEGQEIKKKGEHKALHNWVCIDDDCVNNSALRKILCSTTCHVGNAELSKWCLCPNAGNPEAAYEANMIPPCLRWTEDFKEIQRERTFDVMDYPFEGRI